MSNVRDSYIDSVGGIMIIYMILGHVFIGTSFSGEAGRFLGFFMPWFFFKAGMYHKQRPFAVCAKASFDRLMKPYMLYSAIGLFIVFATHWINGDHNWRHYVLTPIKDLLLGGCVEGQTLWFLLSLCAVRMLYNRIGGGKNEALRTALIVCATAAIGILHHYYAGLLSHGKFFVPWYLVNIPTGLCFYALGHYLRERQFHNKIIICLAIIVTVLEAVFALSIVDMKSNTLIVGNYWWWIPVSTAGIIAINNIFYRLPQLDMLHLRSIGRDSMVYYVWHMPLIILVSFLVSRLGLHLSFAIHNAIIIALLAILLPTINKISFLTKYLK